MRRTARPDDLTAPAVRTSRAAVTVLLAAVLAAACGDPSGPSAPGRFIDVSAGTNHTCAIGDNGQAFCWGDDRFGQLGADMQESCRGRECTRPVPVAGSLRMTDIALGERHTCGVAGGQVYCWGIARFGQLGDDSLTTEICLETPAFRCAVVPRRAALGVPVVSVTAGDRHTCALATSGRAYCWGRNLGMQLGTGDALPRAYPVRVETILVFQSLSTGLAHTCGVAAPSEGYCWGYGGTGRLGTGDTRDRPQPARVGGEQGHRLWRHLDAGGGHTCGLETNGVVSCWGLGNNGQLGIGDRISRPYPIPVELPQIAVHISAGGFHSCAALDDGSLYCWGLNESGQLGLGTTARQLTPTRVPLDQPVVSVSAGLSHTCAVTERGEVYCWGTNGFGQLGDGSRASRLSPVHVEF